MASLQIVRSSFSPFIAFRSNSCRKSSHERGFRVYCRPQDSKNEATGEEPPESLFMKELKKRGMTPTSLLENKNKALYDYGLSENEMSLKDEGRGLSKRNGVVSTDFDKSLSNQREVSMSLNSEGLEGLIPRAKLLLTLGGTFFLGFWPLILLTVAIFSALYFYFGPSFVHAASNMHVAPPPYIDPYELLEDEMLSQSAPQVK